MTSSSGERHRVTPKATIHTQKPANPTKVMSPNTSATVSQIRGPRGTHV
jgi:hypothetical protein